MRAFDVVHALQQIALTYAWIDHDCRCHCAGSGSALRANPIKTVPKELFFVIRTVQLLRGLAHAALGPGGLDVEAAWLRFAEVAAAEGAG